MARLISLLGASIEEFLKNRSLLNAFQMRNCNSGAAEIAVEKTGMLRTAIT